MFYELWTDVLLLAYVLMSISFAFLYSSSLRTDPLTAKYTNMTINVRLDLFASNKQTMHFALQFIQCLFVGYSRIWNNFVSLKINEELKTTRFSCSCYLNDNSKNIFHTFPTGDLPSCNNALLSQPEKTQLSTPLLPVMCQSCNNLWNYALKNFCISCRTFLFMWNFCLVFLCFCTPRIFN